MKWLSLVLCLLWSGFALGSSASVAFTALNPPGPYAVGFRVVLQYDHARSYRSKVDFNGQPFHGERARPIQTLIWYPAQKNSTAHVTYGDYLKLFATEENFSPTPKQAAWTVHEAEISYAYTGDPASMMRAVKGAKPQSGKYPVFIYAPSFSAPAFENVDLCEYLASYGYVVIASPDMGERMRGMSLGVQGVETQAADISFLVGFAHTIPQADTSHIAVGGFSWGGISNLFAAAKDNRITALIGYDGSARYFSKIIQDAKYVHPENMNLPILFFTSNITLEQANQYKIDICSGDILNQMTHSDVYIAYMHDLRHGDFSGSWQRSPAYWQLQPPHEFSQQEKSESYGWVARYTLEFLNAYFKHDPAAMTFLHNLPAKNGVPNHLLTTDVRKGKPAIPPTIAGLAAEMGKRGFDRAQEVYDEAKSQNPDMKIAETEIDGWGQELMSQDHVQNAIDVFKLNASLHPKSANAYDSLGQAYELNGQKDLAIANYKKALEINPDNLGVKAHLAALQSSHKEP